MDSPKFSGQRYIGRIARSSLRQHSFLVVLFLFTAAAAQAATAR